MMCQALCSGLSHAVAGQGRKSRPGQGRWWEVVEQHLNQADWLWSLRANPLTLRSAVGRWHLATAPLGLATRLSPQGPRIRPFLPMLGSHGQTVCQGSCWVGQGLLRPPSSPSNLWQAFPSESFVLLFQLSVCFTWDPRDPASPTCSS